MLPKNMEVLLRWYDNRVMAVLLRVLDEAQQSALFADMSFLAFADRRGMLHTAKVGRYSVQSAKLPITLTNKQEAQLIEAAETDALIDVLLEQGQSTLMQLLPPDQFERGHALWSLAEGYGIHQEPEQVAFCQLGLELGPDFHLQPPWRTAIRRAAADGGKLIDALERLDFESADTAP